MLALVDGRRDGFGLQLRLCLSRVACAAQTMTANAFGKRAFDACPQCAVGFFPAFMSN
jgi:hypothetical protein